MMKLNTPEILSEAWSFYKTHFKKVCIYALIILVLLQLMNLLLHSQIILKSAYSLYYLILAIPVFIALIIILPKTYLALYWYISTSLDSYDCTIRETYQHTKYKYGTYIANGFKLIPYYIPLILLAIPWSGQPVPYAGILAQIYFWLIMPLFYTLFPMIALSSGTNRYLTESRKLIKGNYVNVLILIFITTTFFGFATSIVSSIYQNQSNVSFYITAISYCILFFTQTFADIVAVIVYRKLARQYFERQHIS